MELNVLNEQVKHEAADAVFGREYNAASGQYAVTYGLYDVKRGKLLTDKFITDGTEQHISRPYGLAVNPDTREIFLTDAKDYVSPGTLYCFTPDGRKKWSVTTGDIPAHFAFLSNYHNRE